MVEARLGSPYANMAYHYELNTALCALVMFRFVGKHFTSREDAFRRVYLLYKGDEKVVGIKIKFVYPTFLETFAYPQDIFLT